jgi:hypothetical protein
MQIISVTILISFQKEDKVDWVGLLLPGQSCQLSSSIPIVPTMLVGLYVPDAGTVAPMLVAAHHSSV